MGSKSSKEVPELTGDMRNMQLKRNLLLGKVEEEV
jgi:hypothetical protein